ncbi:hypothetical protein R3I93_007093 [Phoxinus phoxinus]|uniref:Uncharacterized protein n=1 Tax=Phoxinus phoxinus TaxID=58324 RepID=A0AAN9H9I0_9TELE
MAPQATIRSGTEPFQKSNTTLISGTQRTKFVVTAQRIEDCIPLPWLASCSLELTSLTPASDSSPTSDLSTGC